jgi:NAD(P)-dependent dehydrogenase (short-subunit alcohol dehydrogenase family)
MTDRPVAIVTGGARGIGRAIAARLARDGYSVVIADRDADAADATAEAVDGMAVPVDVADSASVAAAFRDVEARSKRIDVLVNCAGIHLQKLVVEMSDEDWDGIQRVNARGAFLMCRAAAQAMMRQGSGRIVNILTRLGFGNPYSAAYMASKSAVLALTQTLAVELAAYGVTVNAVAPGHVGPGTGMEKQFRDKAEKLGLTWEAFEGQVLKTIPIGRWCSPEDVAGAVAWIVSPDASFVTGELVNVTGGFTGYGIAPPKVPA